MRNMLRNMSRLLNWLRRTSGDGEQPPVTIFTSFRLPFFVGLGAMVMFGGGLVGWSVMAPIAGAVIAMGRVTPEGTTRTIQHLEGGILEEVLVREGEMVSAGQPLVRLRDIKARADHQSLSYRIFKLRLVEARLLAEQMNAASWQPSVPINLSEKHKNLIAGERNLFDIRRKSRQEEIGIYDSRVEQLYLAIRSLEGQSEALKDQALLLEEDIRDVGSLVKKQYETQSRLRGLKRTAAQIREKLAFNQGRIIETREQISDFRLRRLNTQSRWLEEVGSELATVQADLAMLENEFSSTRDVMKRTIVKAPVSGIVANIRMRTIGGVFAPGAEILDVVPEDEPPIVEARVAPTDIDHVRSGQNALVHLSAYSHRNSEPLSASVETVSADLLQDQVTGESYYSARIRIDDQAIAELPPEIELSVGMPTEVFITTDPRTVLSYLVQPLTESLRRAIREP